MAKLFANSEDPDQTLPSVASNLGMHCLPSTSLRVSRLVSNGENWDLELVSMLRTFLVIFLDPGAGEEGVLVV